MRLFWIALLLWEAAAREQIHCPHENGECSAYSSLQPMTVDLLGHNNETFWAYVTPDVSTFYQDPPGTRRLQKPKFHGQFAKFINLSNKPVQVWWDAGPKREASYIADLAPFDSAGTASYPKHKFFVTPRRDKTTVLETLVIEPDKSLYSYEDPDLDPTMLSKQELELYTLQKNNLAFATQYRDVTGRDWIVLYGKREATRYPIWPANYFGQTHDITTKETHFVQHPSADTLKQQQSWFKSKYEYRRLQELRSPEETLNLTLEVISCEPRAFEIKNFLSETEVDHIMEIATGVKLHQSTTRAGASGEARTDLATRTSRNTWISRERSPVIDSIYRRAADLLQIDESLMRKRNESEFPDMETKTSIAERLQLVHYDVGQQYTPHHDFSMPPMTKDKQPARYATILFYLNDDTTGLKGGETSFPRWMSAESGHQLKVNPEKGKV
jgi:prolyl 4-hydroxylase